MGGGWGGGGEGEKGKRYVDRLDRGQGYHPQQCLQFLARVQKSNSAQKYEETSIVPKDS